jgi:predicted protein tyrosine phosphatase
MLPSYVIIYFWPENKDAESQVQSQSQATLINASTQLTNADPYNNITTHLYLGSIDSLKDSSKFSLIVNCTKTIEFPDRTNVNQTFLRIPVNDDPAEGTNLLRFITVTQVLEKIHYCRVTFRQVLVHCHAGMQRSCAIVACYLMKYYRMNVEEAIALIKKHRPIAFYGKPTFMNDMIKFHKLLQK